MREILDVADRIQYLLSSHWLAQRNGKIEMCFTGNFGRHRLRLYVMAYAWANVRMPCTAIRAATMSATAVTNSIQIDWNICIVLVAVRNANATRVINTWVGNTNLWTFSRQQNVSLQFSNKYWDSWCKVVRMKVYKIEQWRRYMMRCMLRVFACLFGCGLVHVLDQSPKSGPNDLPRTNWRYFLCKPI